MAELSIAKRGISYPSISLEEAVKRAEQLWNAERKNATPVEVAVSHWSYSPKSSGGRLVIAALKSFGLIIDSGSNDSRQIQLSENALNVLLHPIDSLERLEALRKCVRKPKIYDELLNKWDISHLPSDQTIRTYLIKDRDFNVNSVDAFIKDYKSSIKYAKLEDEITDILNDLFGNEAEGTEQAKTVETTGNQQILATLTTPAQTGAKQDVFALSEGNAVLSWPDNMSAESFEDFKDWLELVLRKVKRTINAE